MNTKYFKKALLSGFVIASLFTMSACGSTSDDTNKVDAEKIRKEISAKYAKEESVSYKDKKENVARDKSFYFTVSDTAYETFKGFTDNWNDIIKIYRDSSLTQQVAYKADMKDGTLSLSPYRKPVFALPDEDMGGRLYDQGEWNDWGNAQQFYIVTYYNLETGEKLEKPTITLFTVKTEIQDTPQIAFYVNDKGVAGLEWKKVKGAQEYAVVLVSEGKDGSSSGRNIQIIDTVKGTKWEDSNKDASKVNWNFRTTFGKSFDTYYQEQKEKNGGNVNVEDMSKQDFDVESEFDKTQDKYFAVIAMNKKGTSKISNLIDKRMCAKQVPVSIANYMNESGIKPFGKNSKAVVDRDISMAPSHTWVIMGNGNVSQKLVNYDITRAKEDMTQYVTYEEDENGNIKKDADGKPVDYKSEDIPCLSIPYTIEGTSIKGYVQILKYDKDNYRKQLKELKKRQDDLRDRTGDIKKDVNMSNKKEDSDSSDKLYNDTEVYASNALSEYLAVQMLNGQSKVDLKDFKEALDKDYLLDAWYEATYQNPLILGVRGISYDGRYAYFSYDISASEMREKQTEIKAKVKEINAKIIKEGMSDVEKEIAINDYLCANAEYDDAALENAEKNNFKKVDEEFNDSFNAYGILINGKGVCAGYAGAFKLLADEAGLKNIVVTGYLEGSMPHAWNRVQLDGEWYTLDTTNNDNEFFSNSLFNLSDIDAMNVLNEDKLYAMDADIPSFKAADSNKEYYRINNKYFSQSEIVEKLAQDYSANGNAVYRTDITLSEEQFYAIAEQVMALTGDSDMRGGNFLGVIYLTR